MIPGRGFPVRYETESRECRYGEDGNTGFRVTVHGASVGVTEDGEAVGIVAGVGPDRAGTRAVAGIVTVGAVSTRRCYHAGAEEHGCRYCRCHDCIFHFHGLFGGWIFRLPLQPTLYQASLCVAFILRK